MRKYASFFIAGCIVAAVLAVPFIAHAQTVSNPPSANSGVVANIGNTTIPVIGFTVKMILYLGLLIESVFITLAGQFVAGALGFNATILNFEPPFITIGWGIFRDIANLGFVIGIVVIAIMTILRVKGYQAQQILWKLVVAALVVNFSLLIGGALIKPANSISCFILSYIGPSAQGCNTAGLDAVAKMGDSFRFTDIVLGTGVNEGGWLQAAGEFFGFGDGASFYILAVMAVLIIFGLVMFLTLLSLAAMLFLRYFTLAFLLMISPLAWLMWIFPNTRKYFKQWWEKFIHWVLFAPLMLLFVYIALRVLDVYNSYGDGIMHNLQNQASPNTFFSEAGTAVNMGLLMTSLFAAALLIGGLKLASTMGHGGTKLALGAVDSGSKYAKKWASNRAKRSGAALMQQPSKLAQKAGYKPGTMQGMLSKAAQTFGKPMSEKSVGGKIATLATLGTTQLIGKLSKEAAIGMKRTSESLKKVRGQDIEDNKKRLGSLTKDEQDAMMGSLNSSERAAVLEIQASKNQINEKTFAAFKTADQKRDAMIDVLKTMADGQRKQAGEVEKKIGASKDMLVAQKEGSATVYERDPNDPTKLIAKQKTFNQLSGEFFAKYSADDWKNFGSNLGTQMYGDTPKHPFGESFLGMIDPMVMDKVLDPYSPALQSIMSRLPSKQQKNFFEKTKKEFNGRKGNMDDDEKDLIQDKMDRVRKYVTGTVAPDKPEPSGGGEAKK